MEYTVDAVREVLMVITSEMISAKEELTAIDSKLGDGDMGISMEKGAMAVRARLAEPLPPTPAELLTQCATALNRAAPSTMGTLLSGGVSALGRAFRDKTALTAADAASCGRLLAEAIAKRGKAAEGDKTILDALIPYGAALEAGFAESSSLPVALVRASKAAHAGMERTANMTARTGRAKWLGERNKDCPDGGAVLCDRVGRRLVAEYCPQREA